MTSAAHPAIVIAAYERPNELRRLLASLAVADIAPGTALVLSIDGGAQNQREVSAVAHRFEWPWGPVRVVEHDHLGLIRHFYWCGDLTKEYGSVVLLEDDLVVGPSFLSWATSALSAASADDRIAGVSLATPVFDGYQHVPFEPVIDGSDAIFMQVPWYDGMAWSADMWHRFRGHHVRSSTALHRSFATLGEDEWFPDAVRYLVETGRYYLLPRNAQVTNSGAVGSHFDRVTNYFQQELTMRGPASFRIHSLDLALAVYDDHMELATKTIQQLDPSLAGVDFTVDLLGTRDLATVTTDLLLTIRAAERPERLWGATMHPLVANLVHNVAGDAISLARTSAIDDSEASRMRARNVLLAHASRGQSQSNRQALRQLVQNSKRFRRGR